MIKEKKREDKMEQLLSLNVHYFFEFFSRTQSMT